MQPPTARGAATQAWNSPTIPRLTAIRKDEDKTLTIAPIAKAVEPLDAGSAAMNGDLRPVFKRNTITAPRMD